MTVIDDFVALSELKKRRAQIVKAIERLVKEQHGLDRRIAVASEVREVTDDGIALSNTVSALSKNGGYARTVPLNFGDKYRIVDMYEKQGAKREGWAVRINEQGGGESMFWGGKCLGLASKWSRAHAARVASAWLTFGKILEE